MTTARGNIAGLCDVQKAIDKLMSMPKATNQPRRMANLLADRKLLAAAIAEDNRP